MTRLRSELELTSSRPLQANKVLCIGCYTEYDRILCGTGKIWQGVQFARVPTVETELTYDDTGKLVDETVVMTDVIRPIGKWSRGYICSGCQGDYRTVTHMRKDGTEWFEPRVQLDPVKVITTNKQGRKVMKPSYSTSVNPGWSQNDELNRDNSVEGPGELAEVTTKLQRQLEIHRPCYSKFARGR